MDPERCPLCDPERVPKHLYARLYEDYGWDVPRDMKERSGARTARALARVGVEMNHHDIWAHFSKHAFWRPQPIPHRRVLPEHIPDLTRRLSARQLEMADLVARVGSFSSMQLRALLYEDKASPKVAQAAHGREVRPLCHRHLLYRVHPPRERISVRESERIRTQQTFHLGRNGQALAAERQGISPPYIRDADKVRAGRLRHQLEVNQLIIDLALAARAEPIRVAGTTAHARISHENWFGPALTDLWFRNPIHRRLERIRPDALIAVALTIPTRNVDALLPLYVMWDSGLRPPDEVVEEVVRHGAVQISDITARRIPLLGRETPPLLLIHETPRRLGVIADLLSRRCAGLGAPERPRVLATDAGSLRAGSWHQPVMTDPIADAPRQTLLGALVGALPQTRTRADITSHSRLRVDMSVGARPPRRVLTAQRLAAALPPAAQVL